MVVAIPVCGMFFQEYRVVVLFVGPCSFMEEFSFIELSTVDVGQI